MNSAYLSCTQHERLSPSSQEADFDPQEQTIAYCELYVPALWLAIFRSSDVREEQLTDPDDGEAVRVRAPLVARKLVARRLSDGLPRIQRWIPRSRLLRSYAEALQETIQSTDREYSFLTIEWDEVATMVDEAAFYADADKILRFVAGERVSDAAKALQRITGVHSERKIVPLDRFLDDEADDLDDADWENLARLLGDQLYRPVSWLPEPESEPAERIEPELIVRIGEVDVDGVRALLQQGIDPNTKTSSGWTALRDAFGMFNSRRRHWEEQWGELRRIVVELVEAGAEVNEEILGEAAEYASLEMFRRLLEVVNNPNARDDLGKPVLYRACACPENAMEKVSLLLDRGADVNQRARNCSGYSVMREAVVYDRIDLARLLFERGADSNAADEALRIVRNAKRFRSRTDWIELLRAHR